MDANEIKKMIEEASVKELPLEKAQRQIGKIIGQPIDPAIPVPPVLKEVADDEYAEVGDEVKKYYDEDVNTGDKVYSIDSTGVVTQNLITPNTPAIVPFVDVCSDEERVHVSAILNSPDQEVVARRKNSITMAMDKKDTYDGLNLCLALDGQSGRPNQEVTQESGMDLYDLIFTMLHNIRPYGDNYMLLMGTDAADAYDTYDKDNVGKFEYNIQIKKAVEDAKISVLPVFEQITFSADGGGSTPVLAANKMIMVARNSYIQKGGKPIVYVRRKISAEIAQQIGAEVDATYRANLVLPAFRNVSGQDVFAFSIFGYEQRILTLLNYRGINWCTYTK